MTLTKQRAAQVLGRWLLKPAIVLAAPGFGLLLLYQSIPVPEQASACGADGLAIGPAPGGSTPPAAPTTIATTSTTTVLATTTTVLASTTSATTAPDATAADQSNGIDSGSIDLAFGRRGGALSTAVFLGERKPGTSQPKAFVVGGVTRKDATSTNALNDRVAVAVVSTDTTDDLRVCIRRGNAEPGLYQGRIAVVRTSTSTGAATSNADSTTATTYLPLTVSFADSSPGKPLLIWVLVVTLGLAYAYYAAYVDKLDMKGSLLTLANWRLFYDWLTSIEGALAFAIGVGAAIPVFMAKYLSSTTWGAGGVSESLTLIGTMLATLTTGGSFVRVLARARPLDRKLADPTGTVVAGDTEEARRATEALDRAAKAKEAADKAATEADQAAEATRKAAAEAAAEAQAAREAEAAAAATAQAEADRKAKIQADLDVAQTNADNARDARDQATATADQDEAAAADGERVHLPAEVVRAMKAEAAKARSAAHHAEMEFERAAKVAQAKVQQLLEATARATGAAKTLQVTTQTREAADAKITSTQDAVKAAEEAARVARAKADEAAAAFAQAEAAAKAAQAKS